MAAPGTPTKALCCATLGLALPLAGACAAERDVAPTRSRFGLVDLELRETAVAPSRFSLAVRIEDPQLSHRFTLDDRIAPATSPKATGGLACAASPGVLFQNGFE